MGTLQARVCMCISVIVYLVHQRHIPSIGCLSSQKFFVSLWGDVLGKRASAFWAEKRTSGYSRWHKDMKRPERHGIGWLAGQYFRAVKSASGGNMLCTTIRSQHEPKNLLSPWAVVASLDCVLNALKLLKLLLDTWKVWSTSWVLLVLLCPPWTPA